MMNQQYKSYKKENKIKNKSKKEQYVDNEMDEIDEMADIELEQDENRHNKPIIKYAKDSKILLRKKELFDHLNEERLEYEKNGICDSFINFGTPSLDTVINDIQTKKMKQNERLQKLIKRLKKEGEIYDENNSYYKKYIQNGGSLDYVVQEGIKEWFYVHKTDYLEILKLYKDEDLAQAKAFNSYIKKNGSDKYTERIRKTEMTIRIY